MPRRLRIGAPPLAGLLGLLAALLVPAMVAAHPLGNFTINHYAGIRVEPDRVLLDVVIDQAEIPTFQARLDFDSDGDGDVSDAEADVGRVAACERLSPMLDLTIAARPSDLTLTQAGLQFPPGAGGLSTMRVVCGFEVRLAAPLAAGMTLSFADRSSPDRLGWREIVVEASNVTLTADQGDLRTTGVSQRLTHYPADMLTNPLADKDVAMTASPGGTTLPPFEIADAEPLPGATVAPTVQPTQAPTSSPTLTVIGRVDPTPVPGGTVPGGVASGDLPSIFQTADLSPIVLVVALATAVALGAGHALTPGHGKTLMAAYLVGTRGTPVHAVGLGLSVTLSHTLGILLLAALVIGAEGVLSPDLVVRSAPVVAAVSILAIGSWMLVTEGRRRRRDRAATHAVDHDHSHDDLYDRHGVEAHGHGPGTHSHLPAADTTISWRSLFILGFAGGLIPSTSALLILLGSIASGRVAFGVVLVVAFGVGMALVLAGVGLTLVLARGRLDGVDARSSLGRVSGFVPLVAAVLVFGLGVYLTVQAVAGSPTL